MVGFIVSAMDENVTKEACEPLLQVAKDFMSMESLGRDGWVAARLGVARLEVRRGALLQRAELLRCRLGRPRCNRQQILIGF